jgi:SAM-dependent methyltransferase
MAADMVTRRRHWESIYHTKGEDELGWHQEEPRLSMRLIRAVTDRTSRIVDIGGGTSPLALRLSELGYPNVTVLDIADSAIQSSQARWNHPPGIQWKRADITRVRQVGPFDLWHDRAVFHFLVNPADRRAYVNIARRTVPAGGHAIIASFARDGPTQCSGLDVARYDGSGLAAEFVPGFTLLRAVRESHQTPWGEVQPFTYVLLRRGREPPRSAARRKTARRTTPASRPGSASS